MQLFSRLSAVMSAILFAPVAMSTAALAQAPQNWSMGMGTAYSPVKESMISLHNLVMVIITVITVFVALLLVWVMVRFNEKANPNPSQVAHHTGLEVAWTVIPVLILVVIAIPSFRLVYFADRTPDPELTVKATGHQWYWEYTYPDQGNFAIESRYIHDEDLKPGQLRMLEVDNQLVIPVGKKIRVLTGSADVIHSFFIPSLGAQRYAIPGRAIEMWLMAEKPGVYYGECNQICGQDHSKMPIAVRAVSDAEFKTWAEQTKKSAAASSAAHHMLAATGAAAIQDIRR